MADLMDEDKLNDDAIAEFENLKKLMSKARVTDSELSNLTENKLTNAGKPAKIDDYEQALYAAATVLTELLDCKDKCVFHCRRIQAQSAADM